MSISSLLLLGHLIGLALGVGAASVKLMLLLKCRVDPDFTHNYLQVAKPITRLIVFGLIVLTLTGIVWLVLGYPFTSQLKTKVFLVVLLWVVGPIIDNVVEPEFEKHLPGQSKPASTALIRLRTKYLALEMIATGLFYLIIVLWVLL
jgi:hypothetical protein